MFSSWPYSFHHVYYVFVCHYWLRLYHTPFICWRLTTTNVCSPWQNIWAISLYAVMYKWCHCHHLSLVWIHTCFVLLTKTELSLWTLCMAWPCYWFVDGLSLKCIIVYKKAKLINHDCLSILMLLYVMHYIMLAYWMQLAALLSTVCLHNASFLPLNFANAFCFHALSWVIDI